MGICLVGNFQNRPPTRKQMETLVRLIERLRDQYGISEQAVFGHRHVRGTACPGAKFPWKSLYARLRLASPAHLARRDAVPTYDLCHWCQQQPEVASAGGRLVRRQAPAAGAELPPPIMLTR